MRPSTGCGSGRPPSCARRCSPGAVDLCVEYTGNAAFFFHQEGDAVWRNAEAGYARAAALDLAANSLVWLDPAPADNSWVIAVPNALAREKTCARSMISPRWRARTAPSSWRPRPNSSKAPPDLPAFEAAYGFRLTARQLLVLSGGETTATMKAAADGISGVNAAMAYGSDGALDALGLVALDDPRHAEPVYAPAPVIRAAALAAWPQVKTALAPVFAGLDLATLRRLNARVAVDGEDAAAVARNYLTARSLL